MKGKLNKKSMTLLVSCSFIAQICFAQYNWTNYDTSNSGMVTNDIRCISNDRLGNTWLGFTVGSFSPYQLIKFDGTNWTTYDTSNSGLPFDGIISLKADTNNNLWVGSQSTGGLIKYDGTTWTVYNTSNSGIISNSISSIALDNMNRIWVGSFQWGLSIFDGTTWVSHNQLNWSIPNNCIHCIAFDDSNKVWFGFDCNGGIAVLNLSDSSWTYYNTGNSNLPSNYISSIAKDTLGNMWVGFALQFPGVAKFSGSNWTTFTPFQDSNTWIPYNSMVFDNDNNLWMGTMGEGLYKFDGTNWTQFGNPLPDTGISSLYQSVSINVDNKLWYGEAHTGLWTTDLTIGINENNFKSNEFALYPNPNDGSFVVVLRGIHEQKIKLNIYSVLGQIVYEEEIHNNGSGSKKINVNGLAPGLYFVGIIVNDKTFNAKFIKQ
ncbi:MAG TPA: two-component regulator propeller domain-containing protein [Bacteroidia bacterium]|nr:two-component regulator propeller domain-containing protein [Bacteroidia bacterium]